MSGCRLVNNITPVGQDVKGGEVVHLALDIRCRRCYSGMRSAKLSAVSDSRRHLAQSLSAGTKKDHNKSTIESDDFLRGLACITSNSHCLQLL